MLYDMLAGGVMVTDRSGHMWWSTERREGGMAVLGYIAVAQIIQVKFMYQVQTS